MTEFQNRRQHWIFSFSVGVTNVQHVASLSLRFVFEKADEQCAEVKCCSCCPKTQHTHSKKQKIKACFIASFAFVLRPPYFGGRKGGCELGPRPYFEKLWRKIF